MFTLSLLSKDEGTIVWSLNRKFTQDKAIFTLPKLLPKVPDWPVQDGCIIEVGRGKTEPGTWAKMRHKQCRPQDSSVLTKPDGHLGVCVHVVCVGVHVLCVYTCAYMHVCVCHYVCLHLSM